MLNRSDSPLRLVILLICGIALLSPPAMAQEDSAPPDEPMLIPKIQGTIELDGRIEEEAWDEARRLPLVQQRPNFENDPTERTEILIGYTEEALYVACRCYDRLEPSASTFKRDHTSGDSDYIGLLLDTFKDNENALVFGTSPTGHRADVAVSGDGTSFDMDWDSFWDVQTTQTEDGWFAEMRIPISSLRFGAAEDGRVAMGLLTWRFLSRETEFDLFPSVPPNWGAYSHLKPSQAQEVIFEDLQAQTLLRLTPYLLGGMGQEPTLNDAETAYERHTDPTYDIGFDLKYGLTNNLTLDLTLNTDFAQVEADDQEINLTRFPLFFPEKRRFFQERSSNFAFDFSGANRLFYSRRIGLHEGEEARILGGARLVGRAGPWDIGALAMQTAREPGLDPDGARLPSENFAVARLRRQVLNENTYVGGILTSRIDEEGAYNVAYGADGIFRVAGHQYVTMRWAQTFQDGAPNNLASLAPARVHLSLENRSYKGLGYDLRYDRTGERYRPAVGLELREDYFRFGEQVGYGWIPGEGSSIQRHRMSLTGASFFRNADGSLQSLKLGPEWEMTSNAGHTLTLSATRRVEDLRTPFLLSEETEVSDGRYGFQQGTVNYQMPSSWDLRANLTLTGGDFYDGRRGTFQISPTWNVSRYLRLSGFYQLNRVVFPGRDQAFTAHLSRLRLEVTPNVEYAVQAFIQYNSAGDVAVGNVRFRYNPREGNDLYLVYNERLTTDRAGFTPQPPLSMQRAVMLKYTYTFDW